MILAASFVIGLVAAFFSSLMGGVAGMIAAPLLLMLGVPPYAAVATPKVGALGIALGSLLKFSKKGFVQWSLVPGLIVLAAIAGLVGAYTLLATPEYILENIVGVLLLLCVVLLWSKKDMGVISFAVSTVRKSIGYIIYFFTETFRAGFGSGFGMLTGTVLTYFFGLTTLQSTATKRIPGVVVTGVALIVFLPAGVIDIPIGIALFFGSIVGSYLGTHYAIVLGNKWAKYLFTVFAVIMASALLLF
ncbi:sulfite exporter TauE/SafE family protein [Patescibacteria group bacterium]|nr:sulfite exporter TauE/SafE family protein [Patescibacteria group bacterium]